MSRISKQKTIIYAQIIIMILIALFVWMDYSEDAKMNLGAWNLVHGQIVMPDIHHISLHSIVPIIYCILLFAGYQISRYISISAIINKRKISLIPLLWAVNILALFWVISFSVKGVIANYRRESDIVAKREVLRKEKTVVHAAGLIEGKNGEKYSYTNSMDALINCSSNGNTISEIDFIWTSDGKLVCAHDGDGFATGIDTGGIPIAEQDFLTMKIFGEYSTMGVDDLANFLRDNENIYIVTDIKDDNILGCKYLAEHCPDLLDRFFIQMYHYNEYEWIRELGFNYIILTLYQTSPEERTVQNIVKAINEYDIMAITFRESYMNSDESWMEGEDFYSIMKSQRIPICVHTVNDREAMVYDLENGVTAVYTDNVDNEWIR